MSLSQQINFDVAGNFTFDTSLIEISAAKAKLKLGLNPGQVFAQDFSSAVGFTYDSTKAEFVGGVIRQRNLGLGAVFGANFTSSANANFGGSTAAAISNGAAAANGKLDLKGSTNKYATWIGLGNADGAIQIGAFRFKITPNYSGSPGSLQYFFTVFDEAGSYNNVIDIYHHPSGLLNFEVFDSAGVKQVNILVAWSPTAGQTYEFELNFDITAGASRIFIDGVQAGSTSSGTGTRTADIDFVRSGDAASTGSGNADFEIDDVMIFNAPQHTANYTPSYSVPDFIYGGSTVALPVFTYTGVGTIQSVDDATIVEAGTPRYIVGGYYWNGSAWVLSNGSYAQANTSAAVIANLPALTVIGAGTVVVSIVFNDSNSTQSSVDEIEVEVTGQIYPTSNPAIINNSGVNADGLVNFSADIAASGSDAVRHQIKIDADLRYWNGSAWVASDGTYGQSSMAADIAANAAALDIEQGVAIKVRSLLHSGDGTSTPELESVTLEYDFFAPDPAPPNECIVYGYLRDLVGDRITAAAQLIVTAENPVVHSGLLFPAIKQISPVNEFGRLEVSLVETTTINRRLHFALKYNDNGSPKTSALGYALVPNSVSVNLTSLTFYDSYA